MGDPKRTGADNNAGYMDGWRDQGRMVNDHSIITIRNVLNLTMKLAL